VRQRCELYGSFEVQHLQCSRGWSPVYIKCVSDWIESVQRSQRTYWVARRRQCVLTMKLAKMRPVTGIPLPDMSEELMSLQTLPSTAYSCGTRTWTNMHSTIDSVGSLT
jgi:hypothetical protein